MVKFDPRRAEQSPAFELELARLSGLVADMEQIRLGRRPEHLVPDAPLLDRWLFGQRTTPCLVGLSTGHRRLTGENRAIVTSDLWLMAEDGTCARTLSRWYRLGRTADADQRQS
jgi:hypothetical protein